jgi:hypothetical protein
VAIALDEVLNLTKAAMFLIAVPVSIAEIGKRFMNIYF